ncbi:monocarboxylate transporter 9-like isoform X2 [Hylaeus volcanicus]|uniref:monocarboxylate transporter 9-like isoform X2 n=1 Tax=Hylaeus volcanicus TaxID=313075 RepID=UPI0023B806BE|nr:monocarboxylate transporter 9-like isoform X2 [Hylaeus volcanicus]
MSRGETDRGWAWVIVAAVTIINLAILPIQQCYGLVFTDRFHSLGITATQTSFILHLNGTITCSLGLISGPMMKRFRFRTVGFFGGLTVAIGICMTAFAVSVPSIIITYCIIVGIGHGVMFPATTLALNTYFRKKRNLAMGFSVTLTGLGPILMPLLIAKLLENYATTGTLLILAGIAMHSLVGASLLKPFNENKITSITKGNDITESSAECNDNSVAKRAESLNVENETEVTNGGVNCELLSNDVERKTEDRERPLSRNAELANRTGGKRKILSRIFKHLDLDLLKDSRYVAVILEMCICNRYGSVFGRGNEFQCDDSFRPFRTRGPRKDLDRNCDVDPSRFGYHWTAVRSTFGTQSRMDIQESLRFFIGRIHSRTNHFIGLGNHLCCGRLRCINYWCCKRDESCFPGFNHS